MSRVKIILIVLFVPIILFTIYLWFSRWPSRIFTENSDYALLFGSIVLGLWFIFRLEMQTIPKWVSAVIYVPIMSGLLILYGIYFVCVFFGDCL